MFGPHLAGAISDKMLADIEAWEPKVGLMFNDALKQAHEVKAASPNTIWVGRPYKPDGEIESWIRANPTQGGIKMYEMVMNAPRVALDNILIWQGNNEILQRGNDLTLLNEASIAFMNHLNTQGLKAAIGVFSVGNPAGITEDGGADWKRFYGALKRAIELGCILGIHQYGKKSTGHLLNHKEFLIQRYERLVYPFLPADVKPIKTICLEYGNDELTWEGWKMGWKEPYNLNIESYISELKQGMELFNQSNILGACGYTHGFENPEWLPYDTKEHGASFASHFSNYSNPNPVPVPTPNPNPTPTPVPMGEFKIETEKWVENCGLTQIIFRVEDTNGNNLKNEEVEISWEGGKVNATQKTGTYQEVWGEFSLQSYPVANEWLIRVKGKNWLTVKTDGTCNKGDRNTVWVVLKPVNQNPNPTPVPTPTTPTERKLINWPNWEELKIKEADVQEGESFWFLETAEFLDEDTSQGMQVIQILSPIDSEVNAISHNSGANTTEVIPLNKGNIGAEIVMWRHFPDGNIYNVKLDGKGITKSDEVEGMHLKGNRHVVFRLTYRKAIKEGNIMPSFDSKAMGVLVKKKQIMSHNPTAALQRFLVNQGYTVILSNEVYDYEGYVAQLGVHPVSGKEVYAVARKGKWGDNELGLYLVEGTPIIPLPEIDIGGGSDRVQLDLPFVSQLSPQASNLLGDCGVTCVNSIYWYTRDTEANPSTPNALADMMRSRGWNPDYARISELNRFMQTLGMNSYHDTRVPWHEVEEDLKKGLPLLALVEYSKFPKEVQFQNYVGGHYVLIVGMFTDSGGRRAVVILDPFRTPTDRYKGLAWMHLEDMDNAWQSSKDFSTPRQAIRLRNL